MKQNRLIKPSKRTLLFSNAKTLASHRRKFLSLPLLAISGIFITTIVLATNRPSTQEAESNLVALPNLSTELQQITIENPIGALSTDAPQLLTLPVSTKNTTIAPTVNSIEALEDSTQVSSDLDANVIVDSNNNIGTVQWQDVTVKSGDNLSRIFPRVGLSARDVYNVAQLGKAIRPLLNLKPGQVLRFDIKEEAGKKSLQQLQLTLSPIETITVTTSTDGFTTSTETREIELRQVHTSGVIESSLFGAGLTAGLSDNHIMQLAYIFGWDIDFALDLRKGDTFTLIYEDKFLDGNKFSDGDILAAEFTNRGHTFRAIRYTDDTGLSNFFSPDGHSMRKAFSRTPVHFSRISSKFNPNRKHPVLKTSRPHRGVDYAAATGTPIMATGDGKIDFRGTKGGYGRTIVLSHGGKYTTLYAHMSSFKKGLKRGSRVKQGQVIGFIGSSGLATGPHLHYEFRVNGVHRNPLTVKLPKAESLAKKYMKDFKQQSLPLLAQLDSLTDTDLALIN